MAHELQHLYGERVHIVSSPLMLSLLAKLGSPKTFQPQINDLVEMLYAHLMDHVIDSLFPKKMDTVETRMKANFQGELVDPSTPCVTVDLARAGTYPSHLCFHKLNHLMNPELVRQDHFYVNRSTDSQGVVNGVTVSGSKIGGGVDRAIVLFPDPMGATGGTIVHAYDHYKNHVGGNPKIMVAMHLMITPEYLKRVTTDCPDLHVFALRLDRGLSTDKILNSIPGTFWDEERGLNDQQYIIPGAGGVGEILNNSYC
jgi:uracil phosphoribosyltransferase